MTDKFTLSAIWIYPVKSLGGIALTHSAVEERGLQYDRRWMIVDENNRFLSQRELPEMVFIKVELVEENNELIGLRFIHKLKENSDPDKSFLYIISGNKTRISVTIWDDEVLAEKIEDEVNTWLSEILKTNCQLVYMPDYTKRMVDKKYTISGDEITSFSDAYPFLIIGQASLDFLNSKLERSITMNRFRPNLVFEGGQPNMEESWRAIQVGEAKFIGVKNCARCPIPTIDPSTAIKSKEPLATLSTYNFRNNKVIFGQNLLAQKLASIKIGDEITLIN
jgi:uncharacterized protein